MELLAIVIFALLLFAIPEMFRAKKQKYEYPELPEPEQGLQRTPLYYEGEGVSAEHSFQNTTTEGVSQEWAGQTAHAMPGVVNLAAQAAEENPWSGQLDLPKIVNGVIFAEILQPPRAKRPVPCWWK